MTATAAAPEPTILRHLPPSDLVALSAATPPCVSMFLPTHRHAPDTDEDRTRLRRMAAAARASLEELRLRDDEVLAILEPAARLLDRPKAVGRHEHGLALLLSVDRGHVFHLPYEVPELSIVGERFHLHPLAPSLADQHVLLLTLTQHAARLFRIDRWSATELAVDDLPDGMDGAVGEQGRQAPNQLRRAPAASGRGGFFHGHGGTKDTGTAQRRRYLTAVERAIRPRVDRARLPLLVAGVRSLATEFRSRCPDAIIGTIDGNPDQMPADELHRAAWAAAAPWLASPRRAAIERFDDLAGTGLTADDPDALAGYTSEGRVETLFLVAAKDLASAADPQLLATLDDALLATLRQGGAVHIVEPGELREGTVAAAILRY
jgi:hypothetical protein